MSEDGRPDPLPPSSNGEDGGKNSLVSSLLTLMFIFTSVFVVLQAVNYANYESTIFGQRHYEPKFKENDCAVEHTPAKEAWEKDRDEVYWIVKVGQEKYLINDLKFGIYYKLTGEPIERANMSLNIQYIDRHYEHIDCQEAVQIAYKQVLEARGQ